METVMAEDASQLTIPQFVRSGRHRFAEIEALVDGHLRLTYAELADQVFAVARAAIGAGIRRGDRVAIWAPNGHRWVLSALGLLSAGAIVVPVNTRFKGREARYVMAKSAARALFVDNGFLGNDYVAMLAAEDPAGGPSGPELVIRLDLDAEDPDQAGGGLPWSRFLALGDLVGGAETLQRIEEVRPGDVSEIIFTSGTTGLPKGVMLTHGQSVRLYLSWTEILGLRAGDRYLISLPLFHTGGNKSGMVACLLRGATMIPQAVFEVEATMRLIQQERVSVMLAPPTVFSSLLDHPARGRYDLSSLRRGATGAAVVPIAMVERVQKELPFETFLTAYGLTECCGTATMCWPTDDSRTVSATSGRAVPGVELRVVDAGGGTLPPDEPGEVLIRGYNVTAGYLDDDHASRQVVDADGWLHTGDIGMLDAAGNLRITDRLKDMFIVGGFNVYPAEIEQLLARHEGVSEVAVVGVPDVRLGEVGRAYVIPRPTNTAGESEIIAWCRDRLANFKVPRSVVFVEALPRNASGKVLKRRLREG
jgi:acyl-CoA synthetase (AMP-forming)/AMP-acid ligase II